MEGCLGIAAAFGFEFWGNKMFYQLKKVCFIGREYQRGLWRR